MSQDRSKLQRHQRPATPPSRARRELRPMPRQVRETGVARRTPGRWTVLGRSWPLPVSPLAIALLATLVAIAGAAWYFEGRYETPPAETAKLILPYKASEVQEVQLSIPEGSATFRRDAGGKFVGEGPPPTPTPVPPPGATPGPITFPPATRVESLINQLTSLRIDRVIAGEPSASPEFGLDKPQLTLKVSPKSGAPLTLAVGRLNPDESAYYARREERRDTVLVSRYTMDDLIKLAQEAIKGTTS